MRPTVLSLFSTCLAFSTPDAAAQGVGQYLEAGQLSSTATAADDELGHAVAIRGDIAVVGSPQVGAGVGAVHVYQRSGSNWSSMTELAVLTPSDGGTLDRFGAAVAIDGDTIVVGSPSHDIGGSIAEGAVYVFVEPPGGWASANETAKLTSLVREQAANFGFAVAIDGDTVAVGAPATASLTGAAYVFEKPVGGWSSNTETAKLIASDVSIFDLFGDSVAVSGSTVVAGAPKVSSAGTAYVFEKPVGGWSSGTELARMTASDQADVRAVAIEGDTVVFGGVTVNFMPPGPAAGAAYLFEKPPGGWVDATEDAILTASDAVGFMFLGESLDLRGGTLAVGSTRAQVGGSPVGKVYVFEKPASGWATSTETTQLTGSSVGLSDQFGFSVAVDGEILVGAPFAGADVGAAFVYESPTLLSGSGCGLPVVQASGSKRIGTTLRVSFGSCSNEALVGLVVGTPRSTPISFTGSVPCGDVTSCLLSCTPVTVLHGATFSTIVENDPSLVGTTLCLQGLCFEPDPCLRITDMTTFVVTN